MYSAAFFESDPRKLVEAGLATLPAESPYAKLIADVLQWSTENPDDWTKVWQLIQDKWDKRDPCPQGALDPFNIDAKLNGAYIALGMLYGRGEFEETIKISTRAGQDSDCNPASAAGVLGVVYGYSGIPEIYKAGIPEIENEKFSFTEHTFKTISESTTQRAVELIQKNGGQFLGDSVIIKIQEPEAAVLESWDDYGSPVERIAANDERWTWTGRWGAHAGRDGKAIEGIKRSASKGAEGSIEFEGTGFILAGSLLTSGGMADVYLDEEPPVTIDSYLEDGERRSESLFHRFGLTSGQHTVRIAVRGEPYAGSNEEKKGRDIVVDNLIVFR
jgi:hypothetical protein